MEEIVRVNATTLTDTEQILYTSTIAIVVKTIMLHNTNSVDTDITLSLDSVIFKFTLAKDETKIISTPIVTNLIEAIGLGVNIHISGIKLEV